MSEEIKFKLGKEYITVTTGQDGSIFWDDVEVSNNLTGWDNLQEVINLSEPDFENCIQLFRKIREFDRTNK